MSKEKVEQNNQLFYVKKLLSGEIKVLDGVLHIKADLLDFEKHQRNKTINEKIKS